MQELRCLLLRKEMKVVPPRITALFLFLNALSGRITSMRLGISECHYVLMRITFKNDITRRVKGTATNRNELRQFGQI